jgi:hypothetical protein
MLLSELLTTSSGMGGLLHTDGEQEQSTSSEIRIRDGF